MPAGDGLPDVVLLDRCNIIIFVKDTQRRFRARTPGEESATRWDSGSGIRVGGAASHAPGLIDDR